MILADDQPISIASGTRASKPVNSFMIGDCHAESLAVDGLNRMVAMSAWPDAHTVPVAGRHITMLVSECPCGDCTVPVPCQDPSDRGQTQLTGARPMAADAERVVVPPEHALAPVFQAHTAAGSMAKQLQHAFIPGVCRRKPARLDTPADQLCGEVSCSDKITEWARHGLVLPRLVELGLPQVYISELVVMAPPSPARATVDELCSVAAATLARVLRSAVLRHPEVLTATVQGIDGDWHRLCSAVGWTCTATGESASAPKPELRLSQVQHGERVVLRASMDWPAVDSPWWATIFGEGADAAREVLARLPGVCVVTADVPWSRAWAARLTAVAAGQKRGRSSISKGTPTWVAYPAVTMTEDRIWGQCGNCAAAQAPCIRAPHTGLQVSRRLKWPHAHWHKEGMVMERITPTRGVRIGVPRTDDSIRCATSICSFNIDQAALAAAMMLGKRDESCAWQSEAADFACPKPTKQ